MIIIVKPEQGRILPDGWDYPIEELDYLLESEISNDVFVLKDGRLYEAELLK